IKHLIEEGQVQESTPGTLEWIRDYAAFIRSVKPDAYTVGEVSGANAAALKPYYPDLLDQYFQFDIAAGTLAAASSGSPLLLGISVGGAERMIPGQRYATFLTNHDQPRVATQLEGAEDRMRVAAMLMLSLPGTPYIYYGEEIGMSGDKPDELIRTPMQWSGEPNGGFSTGTPWEPLQPDWSTVNVAAQEGVEGSLLETYRRWIGLRADHAALSRGSFTALVTESRSVLAFARQVDGETVVVVINTGEDAVSDLAVTLPEEWTGAGDPVFQDIVGADGESLSSVDGVLIVPEVATASGIVLMRTER
nr:alpha-glucosidase C-terminal domain-containing protein [Chloroflexia bacterium]